MFVYERNAFTRKFPPKCNTDIWNTNNCLQIILSVNF